MNQLERITFEISILKEAIIIAQDRLAKHKIPAVYSERILAKYQTNIRQLSTSIIHQEQRQKLQQLEQQRRKLMHKYQAQLTEIQQAIYELKQTTIPDALAPSTHQTARPSSPSDNTPQLSEQSQSSKRSRFRRLFH